MISDVTTPAPLRQSFLNLGKARRLARERFLAGRKAERYYQRQLAQSRARSGTSFAASHQFPWRIAY